MNGQTLNEIEVRLQYVFGNKRLLEQAFTHSSFANVENIPDNERMEFFGDAILEYLSSEYLYNRFPNRNEGELSAMRARLVSADGLYPIVDKLGLIGYLQTLNVELSHKTAANLFEAVLCAIYLDGGIKSARRFFLRTMKDRLQSADIFLIKDDKTLLQEYCQKNKMSLNYVFVDRDGPDNKPTFRYEIYINGKKEAEGIGPSKKAAEQAAANKLVTEWRIR